MSTKVIATVSLPLLFLAGCTQPEKLSPDFGNSVRHNMAAQVINPTPPGATAGAPETHGEIAGGAMERYRMGSVKAEKFEGTRSDTTEAAAAAPKSK